MNSSLIYLIRQTFLLVSIVKGLDHLRNRCSTKRDCVNSTSKKFLGDEASSFSKTGYLPYTVDVNRY